MNIKSYSSILFWFCLNFLHSLSKAILGGFLLLNIFNYQIVFRYFFRNNIYDIANLHENNKDIEKAEEYYHLAIEKGMLFPCLI
jgi:hypothetical protein